jgi:hypothetical protein
METGMKIERVEKEERELAHAKEKQIAAMEEVNSAKLKLIDAQRKKEFMNALAAGREHRIATQNAAEWEKAVAAAQLEATKAKSEAGVVEPDYKEEATRYYNERKKAYEAATTKGEGAKSAEKSAIEARKIANESRDIAQKNDATQDQKEHATTQELNADKMMLKATVASAESKSADRKDHFRNAADRDRVQKAADEEADSAAKTELTNAQKAFQDAEKKFSDSAKEQPRQQDTNGSDTSGGSDSNTGGNPNENLKTAAKQRLDAATTKATEAQKKVEPSWASKLVDWWAKARGTSMGMAHHV